MAEFWTIREQNEKTIEFREKEKSRLDEEHLENEWMLFGGRTVSGRDVQQVKKMYKVNLLRYEPLSNETRVTHAETLLIHTVCTECTVAEHKPPPSS